jgi:hypothetical protein
VTLLYSFIVGLGLHLSAVLNNLDDFSSLLEIARDGVAFNWGTAVARSGRYFQSWSVGEPKKLYRSYYLEAKDSISGQVIRLSQRLYRQYPRGRVSRKFREMILHNINKKLLKREAFRYTGVLELFDFNKYRAHL